jgi:hypothetical protein
MRRILNLGSTLHSGDAGLGAAGTNSVDAASCYLLDDNVLSSFTTRVGNLRHLPEMVTSRSCGFRGTRFTGSDNDCRESN